MRPYNFMYPFKIPYILVIIILLLGISKTWADGFIVVPPPRPLPGIIRPLRPPIQRFFPLEVSFHKVDVKITDMAALTKIDQEFYNPTAQRLEGYYIFPIPKGATIDKFSMFINGKETEAEMLDAGKARKIYEDIVRKMVDPALLEYYKQGLFKARIFPIEPHSKKRVKISYNQILEKDNGTIEYLYPLNTEKFSAKPLKDVAINVEITSKSILKNIYCVTHEVDIVRKGDARAIVSYEDHGVKPDKDFSLFFKTDNSKVGLSLLTYRESGKKGHFFMNISPDISIKENEIEKKDIIFVLDVSGSMAGDKLKQAKKALLFCIANLNKGDKFEVIRFSTEAEALFNSLSDASNENVTKAKAFIENLRAIGGTNIDEALNLALNTKGNQNRPHTILFITDGKPTINETNEDKLVDIVKNKKANNTKIFTFGIGNEINTHLLDKITDITKAYRTYISPEEDIEVKISNLYTKVQSPVLTNLKLKSSGNIKFTKLYPKVLPDLFKGSSVTLLGRYSGVGIGTITLEGVLKGKIKEFTFKSEFAKTNTKNEFIPPLWAARRVGFLLDQIRLNGENKELVDEVVELARSHGIITPYTSYLIVEDEEHRVAQRSLSRDEQTIGNITPKASPLRKKAKSAYSKLLKEKSGSASVRASEKVQSLNYAESMNSKLLYDEDMSFKDKEGNDQNLSQQFKNIQGRAIYNTGSFWVDSYIQTKKYNKMLRVQYASKDYFKLLNEYPKIAEFYALGQNVKFVFNNIVYEIFE